MVAEGGLGQNTESKISTRKKKFLGACLQSCQKGTVTFLFLVMYLSMENVLATITVDFRSPFKSRFSGLFRISLITLPKFEYFVGTSKGTSKSH